MAMIGKNVSSDINAMIVNCKNIKHVAKCAETIKHVKIEARTVHIHHDAFAVNHQSDGNGYNAVKHSDLHNIIAIWNAAVYHGRRQCKKVVF